MLRSILRLRCSGCGSAPGMSLIEVMVAIVVLVILVTLTFMGYDRVRTATDRIGCASNLRQTGLAIHLHAADHDGLPPGPNRGDTVYGTYTYRSGQPETAKLTLWDHLIPYLELPEPPSGQRYFAEVGMCPAVVRLAPDDIWLRESKYYSVNIWRSSRLPVAYPNHEGFPPTMKPFGSDAGLGDSRLRAGPDIRLNQVADPSLFAIMMDLPGNTGSMQWQSGLPREFSHTYHFNILYLDGRIETVSTP